MKSHVNSSSTYIVLAASLIFLLSTKVIPAQAAGVPAVAITTASPVSKSYREWKMMMVGEADSRLKMTRDALSAKTRFGLMSPTDINLNSEIKNLLNQYDKEKLQLSMAHDLTISDYFVGYLTKQKELDKAIKEVSSRLSAEEVAELMSAYANNFFSSTPTEIKQAPQAELKTRLGQ